MLKALDFHRCGIGTSADSLQDIKSTTVADTACSVKRGISIGIIMMPIGHQECLVVTILK